MRNMINSICLVLMLSACAGREPNLAPIVNANDNQLSCFQLKTEIEANNQTIVALLDEEEEKRAQNILAGTVGVVLFAPALFLMDFQDAAGVERQALQQRQTYLASLISQRCGETVIVRDPTIEARADAKQRQAAMEARAGGGSGASAPVATTAVSSEPGPTISSATATDTPIDPAAEFATVPQSPPLTEGTPISAFTNEQIQAYCSQSWMTRINTQGRTEYNPCLMPSAFE